MDGLVRVLSFISKIKNFDDIRAVKLEKRLVEHLRSTVAPLSLARNINNRV